MNELRFSFVLPRRLAGMRWPGFAPGAQKVVDFLHAQGVRTIVNLTTSPDADAALSDSFRVVYENVADMCAPTVEQMDRVYRAFRDLEDGEAMAVHCLHGLGRTGTALACIVGRHSNQSASSAMGFVRQMRPGSIESEEQELFVAQYLAGRVRGRR